MEEKLTTNEQESSDINAPDSDGVTLLTKAVGESNQDQLVALLMNPEIDPNLPSSIKIEIIPGYLQYQREITPLMLAVHLFKVSAVEALLAHPEIQVNDRAQDLHNDTPLMMAVRRLGVNNNNGAIIRIIGLLLKHREIDPSMKDFLDKTALDLAKEIRPLEIRPLVSWLRCLPNPKPHKAPQYIVTLIEAAEKKQKKDLISILSENSPVELPLEICGLTADFILPDCSQLLKKTSPTVQLGFFDRVKQQGEQHGLENNYNIWLSYIIVFFRTLSDYFQTSSEQNISASRLR